MLLSSGELNTYLRKLEKILGASSNDAQLFKKIVDAPFSDKHKTTLMGLGIVVLLLVDKDAQTINRVALSKTDLARNTTDISIKRFEEIKIPLNHRGNFIAEAIRSGRYQQTSDWRYLFAPSLTAEEAHLNQAGGGIACSFVYPLNGARDGGALIFSYYILLNKIGAAHKDFMYRYSKLVAAQLSN